MLLILSTSCSLNEQKNLKEVNLNSENLESNSNLVVVQGDMIFDRRDENHRKILELIESGNSRGLNATNAFMPKWDNGKVPYYFDQDISSNERQLVKKAMSTIEAAANISFQERSTHSSYVLRIRRNGNPDIGGDATIGRIKWPSTRLNFNYATILHELLHVLGVAHEHSRFDRDLHINIHFDNIENKDYEDNFYIFPGRTYYDYDYYSIMHYSDTAMAKSGKRTITTKNSKYQDIIGQRFELSDRDAKSLRQMYGDPHPTFYIGNFNNDNKIDLLQMSNGSNSFVATSLNRDIEKMAKIPTAVGKNKGAYVHLIGDVNKDGRDDVIQMGPNLKSWVGISDSEGNFQGWTHEISTGRHGGNYRHYLADVNGDGRKDLIQTGPGISSWIGLADKNGKFKIWTHKISTGRHDGKYQHYFADINGDGREDMLQTGDKTSSWIGLADISGNIKIWTHKISTGRHDGKYQHHLADVSGDGKADLIQTGNETSSWIGIANSSGNFKIWTHKISTGRHGGKYQHHFADLNGDGRADMLQTGNETSSWIGLSDPSGKIDIWTHKIATGRHGGKYKHYLADVNGDGRADMIQTFARDKLWIGYTDINGKIEIWSNNLGTRMTAQYLIRNQK